MSILTELQNIDCKTNNPDDVRNILNNHIPYIPYNISKGVFLIRSRKGGGFKKRSDMTYCPVKYCKENQRATLPGYTMFYGVLSDDQSHLENARAISVSECSKLCREGNKSIGRETFTVSQWNVVKPLTVASFITDATFPDVDDNKLLNKMREQFIDNKKKNKIASNDADILKFISKELGKLITENDEYLISATVCTDLINSLKVDGIVYPSVQLGGQAGLNIALSPKAVNEKLSFIRTFDHTIFKNGTKSLVCIKHPTIKKGKIVSVYQIPEDEIIKHIGIKSISELPEV